MEKPYHNRCWPSEKNLYCEIILKKTITIFLLSLMLFNMVGYRFVFAVLDNMATQKLDARLDAGDYAEENLVEIKVPLNMPYQNRVTEFERHYGEIIIEGKAYTYVKMRIDKDMLVLKCIANSGKEQLKNTSDNLAKANSGQDMENNGKKHNTSFSKNITSDYDNCNQFYDVSQNIMPVKIKHTGFTTPVLNACIPPLYQPPRC
jgi:hypothetical protein